MATMHFNLFDECTKMSPRYADPMMRNKMDDQDQTKFIQSQEDRTCSTNSTFRIMEMDVEEPYDVIRDVDQPPTSTTNDGSLHTRTGLTLPEITPRHSSHSQPMECSVVRRLESAAAHKDGGHSSADVEHEDLHDLDITHEEVVEMGRLKMPVTGLGSHSPAGGGTSSPPPPSSPRVRSRCNTWPRVMQSEFREKTDPSETSHDIIRSAGDGAYSTTPITENDERAESPPGFGHGVPRTEDVVLESPSRPQRPPLRASLSVPATSYSAQQCPSPHSHLGPSSQLPLVSEEGFSGDEDIIESSAGPNYTKSSSRRNPWGNFSYADLITQAILSTPEKRLTLAQIYDWMVANIQYFKERSDSTNSSGWKNSIRHNLSLHQKFVKVQNDGAGKSSWWTLSKEVKQVTRTPRRRAASMETNRFRRERERARERAKTMSGKLERAKSSSTLPQQSCQVQLNNGSVIQEVVPSSPLPFIQRSQEFRSRTNSTASSENSFCLRTTSNSCSTPTSSSPHPSPSPFSHQRIQDYPTGHNSGSESELNINIHDLNIEPGHIIREYIHPSPHGQPPGAPSVEMPQMLDAAHHHGLAHGGANATKEDIISSTSERRFRQHFDSVNFYNSDSDSSVINYASSGQYFGSSLPEPTLTGSLPRHAYGANAAAASMLSRFEKSSVIKSVIQARRGHQASMMANSHGVVGFGAMRHGGIFGGGSSSSNGKILAVEGSLPHDFRNGQAASDVDNNGQILGDIDYPQLSISEDGYPDLSNYTERSQQPYVGVANANWTTPQSPVEQGKLGSPSNKVTILQRRDVHQQGRFKSLDQHQSSYSVPEPAAGQPGGTAVQSIKAEDNWHGGHHPPLLNSDVARRSDLYRKRLIQEQLAELERKHHNLLQDMNNGLHQNKSQQQLNELQADSYNSSLNVGDSLQQHQSNLEFQIKMLKEELERVAKTEQDQEQTTQDSLMVELTGACSDELLGPPHNIPTIGVGGKIPSSIYGREDDLKGINQDNELPQLYSLLESSMRSHTEPLDLDQVGGQHSLNRRGPLEADFWKDNSLSSHRQVSGPAALSTSSWNDNRIIMDEGPLGGLPRKTFVGGPGTWTEPAFNHKMEANGGGQSFSDESEIKFDPDCVEALERILQSEFTSF